MPGSSPKESRETDEQSVNGILKILGKLNETDHQVFIEWGRSRW